MEEREILRKIPSVDEVLRGPVGAHWLEHHTRGLVVRAIRQATEGLRSEAASGVEIDVSVEAIGKRVGDALACMSALSLKPVINATGIVIHTNLGRSALCPEAIENVAAVAAGYSTLEYDLQSGRRGSRHAHIGRLLREVTGAEAGIAVNNNAGAVLLALATIARGREVIVSRGELVEIGGSFRVPDVMAQSGAILKEVGATNKTHLRDYEAAINENTALILKVHRSNFRITGFTGEVPFEALAALGRERNVPVMFDLGSGGLVDLRPIGVHSEPPVREIVGSGVDVVTFSGDKLLGGPQAGIIAGESSYIGAMKDNPLQRALRIDKLSLAALEATLVKYLDPEAALEGIPTLRMLFENAEGVRRRARRLARAVGSLEGFDVRVVEDKSFAGGGSLPGHEIRTYALAIRPLGGAAVSPNVIEERLRKGNPPVIARIKGDALLLDARSLFDGQTAVVAHCVKSAVSG